jgi:hypothetical protein
MQAKWVGPIGRSCRKDARQGPIHVPAGMQLQYIAMSFVKPGNEYNVIAHPNTFKPLCKRRLDFEPCVGASFGSLVGCLLASGQFRAYYPNGVDRILGFNHILLRATAVVQSELLYNITFAREELDNASLADQMAGADDYEIAAI